MAKKQSRTEQHISLTGLDITWDDSDEGRTRPALRAATLELTDDVLRTIVAMALNDEMSTPVGRLRFLGAAWIEDEAQLTFRVKAGGVLATKVTLQARLEVAPSGRLRVRITKAKAGLLPFTPVLSLVIDMLAERPGFYRVENEAHAVDIDIAELLRAHEAPINWIAPVRHIEIRPGLATVTFSAER